MSSPLLGTLNVNILRAQNLLNKDGFGQGLSDPYALLSIVQPSIPDQSPYKTKIIDDCLNPIWNENFRIVLKEKSDVVVLNCKVFDEDLVGSDDLLGYCTLTIKSDFPFHTEKEIQLTPPGKEKSAGSIFFQIEYVPGEFLKVEPEKIPVTAGGNSITLADIPTALHYKRAKHDVLTKIEEEKMNLIQEIFKQSFNQESDILKTIKKEKFVLKYQKAAYQVDETFHNYQKFALMMKKSDGAFFVAAQQIIQEILEFQSAKRQRKIRAGYLDDPENLFCEELKYWAASQLCTWEISKTALNHVSARIAYLEQILLTGNVFDGPTGIGDITIQQMVVSVRRKLKYQLLADIEKELSSEDAVRMLEELRKHCSAVIYNCFRFLQYVFRSEEEGVQTAADKLLFTLQEDPNISSFLGDSLSEVMSSVHHNGEVRREKYSFSLGEKGMKPVLDFLDITKLSENDPLLNYIFTEKESGLEQFFRSNAYITYKYLRAHGLLLELGGLFKVIEKAKEAAKQGGTLLVYGVANAQFNILLDSTKSLLTQIRDEFAAVTKISECAFEKLVYDPVKMLSKSRSKWIHNFKMVFPCGNEINLAVRKCLEDVGEMKLCANSMTMYQRFQKVQKDTDEFLSCALSFSQRTSKVLNLPEVKLDVKDEELKKNAFDNNEEFMSKIQAAQNNN